LGLNNVFGFVESIAVFKMSEIDGGVASGGVDFFD
jgi:hypothetical protein